jgi:putative Mg2+ transporter-C (MgtC) family protein
MGEVMNVILANLTAMPSSGEVAIRLGLAMIAGMLVGLERETQGRPAGFRTTTIVCLAAALAMIISEVAFVEALGTSNSWRPDPMRLASGLLTGMGFLGAGTIVRNKYIVRGITTAATLWFSTILGLCFGAGAFGMGIIGLLAILFILIVLPGIENRVSSSHFVWLTITMNADAMSEEKLKSLLHSLGVAISSVELDYDFIKKQKTVACEIKLKKCAEFGVGERVISLLSQQPGVHTVSFKM